MMGVTDTISSAFSSAFSDGIGLLSKSSVQLFTGIAKVYILNFLILAIVILAISVVIIGLIASLFGSSFLALLNEKSAPSPVLQDVITTISSDMLILFVVIVLYVLPFIILALINQIISSVNLNVVEDVANSKDTSIMEKLSINAMPVLRYTIFIWLIYLIIFSPVILAFVFGGGLTGLGVLCIVLVFLILFFILFQFLFQFSYLELVLNRRGVIESLKKSFSLVKSNLVTVFVFDIIYILLTIAVTIPLSITQWLINIVGQIIVSISGLVGLGVIVIVIYVLFFLISVVIATLIPTPFFYFFWKRISEVNTSYRQEPIQSIKEELKIEAQPRKNN